MTMLDPISVASGGYLCSGGLYSIPVASDGYLCDNAVALGGGSSAGAVRNYLVFPKPEIKEDTGLSIAIANQNAVAITLTLIAAGVL